MAGTNTLTITDGTWDSDVLKADVPVLVDFWADGCPPCRMMSPSIDSVADEYAGKAKVGKLKTDENPAAAMRYRVRAVPTLLVFKGGDVVAQKVGALSKVELKRLLDQHL
jgi:thioredoxin 1